MLSSRQSVDDSDLDQEWSTRDQGVQVWLCDTSTAAVRGLVDQYVVLLSEEELARAARFRYERDRFQRIASCALVRTVLGSLVGASPNALKFSKASLGRPILVFPASPSISFNVSHSGNWIALAVSCDAEVGVDVEWCVGAAPIEVAERYFTKEEVRAIREARADLRSATFLQFWVLKESYLKALGAGLHKPLNSFSFQFREPDGLAFHADGDQAMLPSFWLIRAAEALIGAVCLLGRQADSKTSLVIKQVVPLGGEVELCSEVVRRSLHMSSARFDTRI